MSVAAPKTYENQVNTAPHPAGYCVSYAPSDSAVFARSSRWIMITDTAAKIVNLRLGGMTQTKTPLVAVSGDIAMGANGALTSTTSSKFSSLNAGDPVLVSGFTSGNNNGLFQVGAGPSGTAITLVDPGTVTPINSVAETPAGTAVHIQGPAVSSQQTVSFTALPGIMYPICADQLKATTTTAAGVLAFY